MKFRVWDKQAREYPECAQFCIDDMGFLHRVVESDSDGLCAELIDSDNFIIQEYTGLKDKTGREIYEGDIVQCWDDRPIEIRWAKAYSGWQWCEYDHKRQEITDFYGGISSPDYSKVIGNIFENPELLNDLTK